MVDDIRVIDVYASAVVVEITEARGDPAGKCSLISS